MAKRAVLDGLLAFIVSYKRQNDGNSPSRREMAEAAKIPSTSMVSYYLEILAEEGEIELPRNGEARLIRVVGAEWRPPGG